MTREELEKLWSDPRNWKWMLYYCKADPRVIVPKRPKWRGWTVNAAHPWAVPVLLLIIALIAVPISIQLTHGAGLAVVAVTVAATVAVICLLCAYLSSCTD